VYLPGPTIGTQVTSLPPVTPRVPELIQRALQETLARNEPRLKFVSAAQDTLVSCTIIELGASPGVEARTKSEYRKTGERTITDPETGISRTEDEYGYVDVAYRALVFTGRMSVKCEVTDVATGIVLYSDRFDAIYTDAREVGAGSSNLSVDDLNAIYLELADNAAGLILAVLSPRVYSEVVALPSGKLKETSKLLDASLWNEALDRLTRMTPFKDPKDDAYRFYSMGVAHEALAYEAQEPAEMNRHLELAADHYREAAQLKPRENAFWGPKNRADLSLWQSTLLVAQVKAFEEAKRANSKVGVRGPDQVASATDLFRQVRSRVPPPPNVITNQTVIQWVKAGYSADYISSNIKHAMQTQFDLSSAGVLKLRREGVSDSTLKAMRESRQGRHNGIGTRRSAIITAISLLWWVPLLLAR
ncbi:MAG TPA: hypothetical protein VNS63_00025, partial [Blastocatellia bacterium]|nr:hypothetical protein [Blastocatellia bacterium]